MEEKRSDIPNNEVLFLAVVQGQDADLAVDALEKENYSVTRLPSVGGFLGRRSATLLITCRSAGEEEVKQLLRDTCRKRMTFIPTPIDNAYLPLPAPTPVTIGGVSLFHLEIEHFEEIG